MTDVIAKSLISLSLVAALTACGEREAVDATPAPPPPVETAPIPSPALPLSRADLIAGAAAAAGAYASGNQTGAGDPMVGRSFSVSLPFGCAGPRVGTGGLDGLARATWQDEARSAVVLSLTPADWSESALITASSADWEQVEGYWIDRTWLPGSDCPVVRADPLQAGIAFAEAPSVGLAAVHEAGGSRLGRRDGRAHRFVLRAPEGGAPLALEGGLRLRLEGRVQSFPDGRAFRCRAAGPDARPTCVAAVTVDRVAFETPDGGVLSEWRSG